MKIDNKKILIPIGLQLILLTAAFLMYLPNSSNENLLKHTAIFGTLAASIFISVILGSKLIAVSVKEAQLSVREAMGKSILRLAAATEDQNKNFIEQIKNISLLIENGRISELENHLGEITKNVSQLNDSIKVDQPIIGALIKSKLAEADIRGIRLETDVSAPLTRQGGESALALARILGNLIDNAFDTVQSCGTEVRWVGIEIKRAGPLLRLAVRNGGPVIPQDDLERIFQEGFTQKGEGHSGIGLYIVRILTEKLSGIVTVCSDEQNGTVFTVTVPAN